MKKYHQTNKEKEVCDFCCLRIGTNNKITFEYYFERNKLYDFYYVYERINRPTKQDVSNDAQIVFRILTCV